MGAGILRTLTFLRGSAAILQRRNADVSSFTRTGMFDGWGRQI